MPLFGKDAVGEMPHGWADQAVAYMIWTYRKGGEKGTRLIIDAKNELRHPDGEPVLGWRDNPAESQCRVVRPLRVDDDLLRPRPAAKLTYKCNLPSPYTGRWAHRDDRMLPDALLDDAGQPRAVMADEAVAEFCAHSLPGGSTLIVGGDGQRRRLHLRWICIASHWSIGAIWRAYASIGGVWTWTGRDYLFDASNALVDVEEDAADATAPFTLPDGQMLTLTHGPEGITQYPSQFGVVKVRQFQADGWRERTLSRAVLLQDGEVRVTFSDGAQVTLGYAEQERTLQLLAA